MRTGESFTFQATVRDANGCATGTSTLWSVIPSADGKTRLSVDDKGNVTVLADAAEGENEITVSAAGKSTRVTVEVSLPGNYDALLAQSGLNASGQSDEAAVVTIATGSLGGQDAKAVGEAQHRKKIFLIIVGTMGALLFLLFLVGVMRSRKAAALEREAESRHQARMQEAEERQRAKVAEHAAAMRAHEESVERATAVAKEQQDDETRTQAMACPACHREFPAQSTYCPSDGSKLIAVAGNESILSGPAGGICPACKRGFDASIKVCPDDGEELVPYAMRGAAVSIAPPRGKICPTCGDRFDGSASFCGKDGTALVLLN
jgi:Na+-transporting methylmalonyl-CoA/oxaloacetate decarboxylase gamma subunit/RNA polymerase subunit RPABC4/transcription elongation factor Spt4